MKRWLWLLLPAALLAPLVWAAFAPIELATRDELFEIPAGTFKRRMSGDKVDILPDRIALTLGLNDVLVLKNADKAPHIFGPALIMPGQTFRLPFTTPSINSFTCSAHSDGQLNIIVEAGPMPGWQRLRWRLRNMMDRA